MMKDNEQHIVCHFLIFENLGAVCFILTLLPIQQITLSDTCNTPVVLLFQTEIKVKKFDSQLKLNQQISFSHAALAEYISYFRQRILNPGSTYLFTTCGDSEIVEGIISCVKQDALLLNGKMPHFILLYVSIFPKPTGKGTLKSNRQWWFH